VVKVVDLTEGNHIERELMLVKSGRPAGPRGDEAARRYLSRAHFDVTDKSYTID